jgi:hypothetical protein
MKKLMFLFLIIFMFSCDKEEKETCWTCIDKYGVEILDTQIICDPVIAASENGKRWKDKWGVWHLITCTK